MSISSEDRYLSTDYLEKNPTWDIEDSPWKAGLVADLLDRHDISPQTLCEVGCGAGAALAMLRVRFPAATLTGWDIAPDARHFWEQYQGQGIHFQVGDFFEGDDSYYNVIMVLDVIEHVADPHQFLRKLRSSGRFFVFHFPLDLSAVSVFREFPLLYVREKVGHIHYYTKGMVLALMEEAGFEVLQWQYSGASLSGPRPTWRTRLARLPRMLARILGKDRSVRLLGGETLLILARPVD